MRSTSSLGDAEILQVSQDGPPEDHCNTQFTAASVEPWAGVSDREPGPPQGRTQVQPGRGAQRRARCRRRPALRGPGQGDGEPGMHRRGGGPNPGQPHSGGPGSARAPPLRGMRHDDPGARSGARPQPAVAARAEDEGEGRKPWQCGGWSGVWNQGIAKKVPVVDQPQKESLEKISLCHESSPRGVRQASRRWPPSSSSKTAPPNRRITRHSPQTQRDLWHTPTNQFEKRDRRYAILVSM
ncbi:uncharacterized protein LOC123951500 [Meles meles]|uniref:uncharacterized protein LOC123951500 n=1 Tax=Meles meles TaxID=9662 RepID=UPI001E69FAF8|nr:uncharacterized protein LOC123951500 [Meles meles]